jgi:hypothetical protein
MDFFVMDGADRMDDLSSKFALQNKISRSLEKQTEKFKPTRQKADYEFIYTIKDKYNNAVSGGENIPFDMFRFLFFREKLDEAGKEVFDSFRLQQFRIEAKKVKKE